MYIIEITIINKYHQLWTEEAFFILKQADQKADADSSVTEGRGRCCSNAAQDSSCLTASQQLETQTLR